MFNIFKKRSKKSMDNETKDLLVEVIDLLKARNEADEKEAKEKADELKGENEDGEDEKAEAKEKADDKEKAETKEEKGDKEKAENKCKAKNEDDIVDKRDIIRQIMAIAGKEENSEEVKTIAKLAKKLGYDKDEADKKEDDEEAKNKCKAKNSMEDSISAFYTEIKKTNTGYITQEKARELGKELY